MIVDKYIRCELLAAKDSIKTKFLRIFVVHQFLTNKHCCITQMIKGVDKLVLYNLQKKKHKSKHKYRKTNLLFGTNRLLIGIVEVSNEHCINAIFLPQVKCIKQNFNPCF